MDNLSQSLNTYSSRSIVVCCFACMEEVDLACVEAVTTQPTFSPNTLYNAVTFTNVSGPMW